MTEIYAAFSALGAALLMIFGLWFRGWLQGLNEADRRQKERDHERAKGIQNAADRARAADDAGHVDSDVERVRKHGRLRAD
jgi:hypothetical protein